MEPILPFFLAFFLSFSTGLVAALNPCVAPIYPLVFSYYLKKGEQLSWRKILIFILGFLGAFFALAGIILGLGNIDPIQEYLRFAAAGIIGIIGIHFLLRGFKIPLAIERHLENIDSPFLFGMVFGLALNPCSLPFFLANATFTTISPSALLNLLGFGLGVALPPILTAFFGDSLIRRAAFHVRGAYRYLDKIIGTFMLIAVAFLVWTVGASPTTAILASLTIFLFFTLLIAPFWRTIFRESRQRTALITLTIFLFLLWGALTFHCTQVVYSTQFMCGASCIPCRVCLSILVGVMLVGYAGFYLLERESRGERETKGDTAKSG